MYPSLGNVSWLFFGSSAAIVTMNGYISQPCWCSRADQTEGESKCPRQIDNITPDSTAGNDRLTDSARGTHQNSPSPDLCEEEGGDRGAGAILIFLPGMPEIRRMQAKLSGSRAFRDSRGACWVLPLHSGISVPEQQRCFQRPPPGARKVVLATNIAETSLTIEDVVFVVDTGKVKEVQHDTKRSMTLLVEEFVSRASAKQRRGRAGRVKAGWYFACYTRRRHDALMRPQARPEMARVPLDELVLQIHQLSLAPSAKAFLR